MLLATLNRRKSLTRKSRPKSPRNRTSESGEVDVNSEENSEVKISIPTLLWSIQEFEVENALEDEDDVAVEDIGARLEEEYFVVFDELSNVFASNISNLSLLTNLGDRVDRFFRRAGRVCTRCSRHMRSYSTKDSFNSIFQMMNGKIWSAASHK